MGSLPTRIFYSHGSSAIKCWRPACKTSSGLVSHPRWVYILGNSSVRTSMSSFSFMFGVNRGCSFILSTPSCSGSEKNSFMILLEFSTAGPFLNSFASRSTTSFCLEKIIRHWRPPLASTNSLQPELLLPDHVYLQP